MTVVLLVGTLYALGGVRPWSITLQVREVKRPGIWNHRESSHESPRLTKVLCGSQLVHPLGACLAVVALCIRSRDPIW